MKCQDCPMQWCVSNESTYPAEYGCEYGEDYYDEHSIEFKDGSYGCRKRYKTVLRDKEKILADNPSALDTVANGEVSALKHLIIT